jgi:enoyl-CoA hydratase
MSAVHLTIENKVGLLTINRPETLNALNSQVLEELGNVLSKVEQKTFSELCCLVLTGAGEKAFVAGADIKEINSLKPGEALHFSELGQKVFRRIETLKIPVIAAVNGFALGGGLELALSCDFIYACDRAKLGLPEVTLGLLPGFGGSVRLSRVVGKARAKEMILSGNAIGASEAFACGLVNRVFPASDLMPEVMKMASLIASRGPKALEAAKKSINETYELEIEEGLRFEAYKFSSLFQTEDFIEGTSAFIEKRKPEFQGL